ncbi:MAG: alpha/beta hydrolase [Clostridia bacterium]|nr:alpha/beta hydrolase [Clostridia bacterium]
MKRSAAFINILLSFTLIFSGMASQLGFIVSPAKYNAKTLVVGELPAPVTRPEADGYVRLSDVEMHYVVYGRDKPPMILVHGNGGSADSLREAATYLANEFTVYLPESRCQGKSGDPGEISYSLMAKDLRVRGVEPESPLAGSFWLFRAIHPCFASAKRRLQSTK